MGTSERIHIPQSVSENAIAAPLMGIHHITALASDPQRNIDFYLRLLGLRLVKRTVNFDAPDVYHLYYGDESGTPGTILTFFPFQDAVRGRRGAGEVSALAFRVPPSAREYWIHRLSSHGIRFQGPHRRFEHDVLSFEDPDGLSIEFEFSGGESADRPWVDGPVPPEYGIKGLSGATMLLRQSTYTEIMLRNLLGFQPAGAEEHRERYLVGNGDYTAAIDLVTDREIFPARQGAGSIHHIAWRVPGYNHQAAWRTRIAEAGLDVTEIIDRQYFRSIYFHEPGGVLFEIATDQPGFTIDESVDSLGTALKLPSWLEPRRQQLERVLPPIDITISLHPQRHTLAH